MPVWAILCSFGWFVAAVAFSANLYADIVLWWRRRRKARGLDDRTCALSAEAGQFRAGVVLCVISRRTIILLISWLVLTGVVFVSAYVRVHQCLARQKTFVGSQIEPLTQNAVMFPGPCSNLRENGFPWMGISIWAWFVMLIALPIEVVRDLIQWLRVRRRMRANLGGYPTLS